LWLAITAVSGIALWHMHDNTLETQLRITAVISRTLANEIAHGLRGVQDGLSGIQDELHESGYELLPETHMEQMLARRARLIPWVKKVWITSRDGRLLAACDSAPPPDLRAFFPPLEQLEGGAVAISRPFTDPVTRDALIALALRLDGATEATGGWIMAAMPTSVMFGTFSVAAPQNGAHMAVFRDDGVRLAGVIDTTEVIDEATVARLLSRRTEMEVHKFADGSERLVSLQGLPHYGLKLMLTRDLRSALEPWRNTALWTATGLALLLAILALAVRRILCSDARYADAQRTLQTQQLRARKFEALGTMASGIAHDVNNVLAVILGYGEMAQDSAQPGSSQARHIDKVLQAALRGKSLVERILTFSRSGAHYVTVFELESIVEEVLSLMESSLRPGMHIERRFEAPGAKLRGDPTQAFEAIMNLCTNAIQSMSNGGTLGIRIRREHLDAPRMLSHSRLAAGDHIALTVSYQGSGIDADVMDHLFEPFFTTRSDRSGTGLGLAVVHGVMGEFGGAIDVQSTPQRGSQFTLYFPECAEAIAATTHPPEPECARNGRQMMIVDDEPALVMLTEEIVRGLCYEPVGYSDPVAALAALREAPERFAAVITDEVMPKLCGTGFTKAVREFAPDLPVLLVSGYGGALLASRASAVGVNRVLSKPLQRAELERTLAELLPHQDPFPPHNPIA